MKRSLRWLGPLFAVALFGLAVFILHRTLGGRSWSDVVDALTDLPRDRLGVAALLVVAAYLILTLFDTMALHRVGTPLRWRSLAQVSFMAYAFGFNLGMPVLSGGAIRYRFYSAAGLTGLDVSRVLAFCVST